MLGRGGIIERKTVELIDRITRAIFDAIDEVNEQLSEGSRLEKSGDTVLYDRSGKLDSLGLVNLIVATEQKIEDEFDVAVILADEKAVSQENSPFKTVGSFAKYIACRMERQIK